ncbi:MAG: response regulator transcription factor [Deltaproteobacteria bacterium]|nr:response regulator transcription factor [Deltaproteobacteria bacterium]
MDRLLIIDDDVETTQIWTDYFSARGYDVLSANDTASGIELARTQHPGCILLDVRFDEESDEAGYFACKKIREFYAEPIIMLSAYKIGPLEKVQGLEFGATGYLEKTVSLRELEGWVKAQMTTFGHQVYRVGDTGQIEVDTRRREVRRTGQTLKLTQTEYKLMAFLCAHRGAPQSKSDLIDLLYADDLDATESRLTSHIYNLRRQIEQDPKKPKIILTVHGFGYRVA